MQKKVDKNVPRATQVDTHGCYAKQKINLAWSYFKEIRLSV